VAAPITPLQLRPEEAPGVKGGLQPLNTFTRQVEQALRGALTFKENHVARIIEAKVPTLSYWQRPTFISGWSDFGGRTTQFQKLSSGLVVMEGGIAGGTVASPAFNLPAKYRPDQQLNLSTEDNGAYGRLIVGTTGDVIPFAAGNAFISMCASWMAADQSLASNIAIGPQTIPHGFIGRCTDLWITACQDTRTSQLIMNPGAPVWYDDGKGNIVLQAIPSLYGPATFALRFLLLSEPA
jgi:hypothetical protein